MSGPRRASRSLAASPAPGRPLAGSARSRVSSSSTAVVGRRLPSWWPLAALLLLGAATRLPTISLQSFWYDEAYTPVHVLHGSLAATLHSVVASEKTTPLWYVLVWVLSRVLGTGVVALRSLSAVAGVALVAVGWAIGAQLGSRRTAAILAAILAVNPLFVWYAQEARAYELYALASAVSLLYFLRALRTPGRGVLTLWAASSILALASHYFAVFLVGPEALLLAVATPSRRREARSRERGLKSLAAIAAVTLAGAALVPLVLAQAGRGTEWIGQWALSDRLVQIPGYYLLGPNGAVLGHGLLALSALPLLAAAALAGALLRVGRLAAGEVRALALTLALGATSILIPLVLALAGADYLAPRNLIADWVPLSAALAVVLGAGAAGRRGPALAGVVCVAATAAIVATGFDSRLQRSDWSAVATTLRPGTADRAIVTVELGAAPLEYYLPRLRLRYLSRHLRVKVREVDLVGYAPIRAGAIHPPTKAFALAGRSDTQGLLVYRYLAPAPQSLSGRYLRSLTITTGAVSSAETLVGAGVPAARVTRS